MTCLYRRISTRMGVYDSLLDCGDGDEEDGVRHGGRCKRMTNNKKRNVINAKR